MRKDNIAALTGTILLHLLLLLLFLFLGMKRVIPQEEMGVEVVFGDVAQAAGEAQYTEELAVNTPPEEVTPPPPATTPQVDEDILSQEHEESIAIEKKKKQEAEEQRKRDEEQRKKQQAEERRKQEIEQKRIAEEKRKADAINKRLSGAFASGGTTGQGTAATGSGIQGSSDGNAKTGEYTGIGGKGSYSLSGRRIIGQLPRPVDKSNEEGEIVIDITVDPLGNVINASINAGKSRGGAATNNTIRTNALNAARKAKFDTNDIKTNQIGTITYVYKTY